MTKSKEGATINFMYFMYNFNSDFIEQCWADEQGMSSHLRQIFVEEMQENNGSVRGFSEWFMGLDRNNQTQLLKWVDENYVGFKDL